MKQLILSAVFFLFSFCVMAQDSPKTRLSIVLSPQISWLDSDHDKVTPGGNVLGYDFGVVVDHFFEKNYAFSTGLTINSTGGKLKYKDGVDMEIGGVIKSGETDATYDLIV